MHREKFFDAIKRRKKIRLTFFSKEDNRNLTRVCAPMDFGPSRRAKSQDDRYHSWDYESDEGRHTLSLPIAQVIMIEVLEESFDPVEFVTWTPNWIYPRDWGSHS